MWFTTLFTGLHHWHVIRTSLIEWSRPETSTWKTLKPGSPHQKPPVFLRQKPLLQSQPEDGSGDVWLEDISSFITNVLRPSSLQLATNINRPVVWLSHIFRVWTKNPTHIVIQINWNICVLMTKGKLCQRYYIIWDHVSICSSDSGSLLHIYNNNKWIFGIWNSPFEEFNPRSSSNYCQ